MADAGLVASLSANLDKFGQDMKRADGIADDAVKGIESKFASANPSLSPALEKMGTEAISKAGDVGEIIGAAIGGGIAAALVLSVGKVTELIGKLAELGDRSDDLRLPVNMLQALSVAATEARVSQSDLNKALDKFTEVSKDEEPKKFNKALENIDESFVKLFKDADSQSARLRVLSDAFKKASDETQSANLANQAFGNDNERLIAIFSRGSDGIDAYAARLRELGLEIDATAVRKAQEGKSQLDLLSRAVGDEFATALASLIPVFVSLLPYFEQFGSILRDMLANFSALADRPIATLQNNIKDVEAEIESLEAANKKLQESGTAQPGLLDLIDPVKTLNNVFSDTGDIIDANTEKVKVLRGILLDLRGALDLANEHLPNIDVTDKGAFKPRPSLDDGGGGKKNEFDRAIDSQNKHAASLEADTEAIGLNAEAHARLRTEAALTEALLRSGIEIDDEYAAKIDEVTNRVGEAARKLDAAKTSFQGLNDTLKFSGNQLVDVLDKAMQKGAKFGDIMSDVLRNVEKQLLQAAITGEGAFAKILGLASSTPGGTGGLLGALFGTAGKSASGTDNWRGGLTWVGEQGPELVNLPKGSQVFPNDVSKQISSSGTAITVAMSNDFRGVDPASITRVEAKLNEMQRTLPSQVAKIVPDLRRRSARGF